LLIHSFIGTYSEHLVLTNWLCW